METRDLLLLIGFLRAGKMFPVAIPRRRMPVERSLRLMLGIIAESERAFAVGEPPPEAPVSAASGSAATLPNPARQAAAHGDRGEEWGTGARSAVHDDLRKRSAVTAWSGDFLAWTSRIGEVPDPGVVLCLVYDGPVADGALPIDVFAQTLRRYALRDASMRASFDEHLDGAGTFVPPWLTPEVRRRRSHEAFERAMRVAHEQGFAAAVSLFEGVRGECYADAQIAIAEHERREIGDAASALERLDDVIRVAPGNAAARMARAEILSGDASRRVSAADDWLAVVRDLGRAPDTDPQREMVAAARAGLRALNREFRNPKKLEAAAALVKQDPALGFEALSRYVHTHPCAWDAQILLASVALARESFDLTVQILEDVRWLYVDNPNPHFVYGQALAARGNAEAAVAALEQAAGLAPADGEIARWLAFARSLLQGVASPGAAGIKVAHHVARTLLLLVGFVRGGHVSPAVLTLHRVPGDVSLALVVQALAGQEQRRFGPMPEPQAGGEPGGPAQSPDVEIDLHAVRARVVLLDRAGARLSVEQLVGDVPDPGVVLALLYESVGRDAAGRPVHTPPPAECEKAIATMADTDTEIAAKLHQHLASPDASLMARLELGG